LHAEGIAVSLLVLQQLIVKRYSEVFGRRISLPIEFIEEYFSCLESFRKGNILVLAFHHASRGLEIVEKAEYQEFTSRIWRKRLRKWSSGGSSHSDWRLTGNA